MAYLDYRGPLEVVLFQGDREISSHNVEGAFRRTHTFTCELSVHPDMLGRAEATRVRVTTPGGTTEEGTVTYSKIFTLVFSTDG